MLLVLKAPTRYLGFLVLLSLLLLGLVFLCSLDYELLEVGIKYFSILNSYALTRGGIWVRRNLSTPAGDSVKVRVRTMLTTV